MTISECHIHNVEAEQALLGAIFVNNAALGVVSGIVRPEHFYEPIHSRIFELCEDAILDGRVATPITLKPKLPGDLDIAGLSPVQYMGRLAAEATTVLCAPDYARTVRDTWAARCVAEAAAAVIGEVADPSTNIKTVISVLLGRLDGIRASVDDKHRSCRPVADGMSALLQRIDAIQAGHIPPSATTGLSDLDQMIGRLQGGRLIIVAGRPGMGKTIVGANIARATAQAGNGCLLFSLEMPDEEINARLAADQAFTSKTAGPPITAKMISEGTLAPAQIKRVEEAAEAASHLPLIIDTSAGLSVSEILAKTRNRADEMRARGVTLRVVIVDYLKFVRASDRYRGQRVYEVGEITAGLKAMAKDLGVAVVLLCQLNRVVEQRTDKRPELSDLRDSGDIEADADVVLLLFREAYYLADKTDPDSLARMDAVRNRLEIIVAKSRMGATGVVQAFCHPGASALRDGGF
ncbi:replicative DNA helicase [Xanthobacter sp. AM11]|uniref:replicative DNA helicase n=1 Tax=Xanthobacter sp. AM11 TaxID=3380643 RepID=UPI0039BF95F3